MKKRLHRATHLIVGVALIVGIVPKVARADDGRKVKSIRLPAREAFGPIGKIYSLGGISINGRAVSGEQMIWGSELLEAAGNASACVLLDSIGLVTLARGAIAKLATKATNLDDSRTPYVLVATLTSGDIVVKLEQDAAAYIETCGLVFISSLGASFRIGIREGQPMIDTMRGAVKMEPQESRVEGRDFKVLPDGRIVKAEKGPVTVKANKSMSADGQFIRNYLGKPKSRSISTTPQFTLIHASRRVSDARWLFLARRTHR